MTTNKNIDFTRVDFITYDVDAYLEDISIFEVVSHYVSLQKECNFIYKGDYSGHKVVVDIFMNKCFVDEEEINAEQFVNMIEGKEVDPCPIIKEITGVDLDDYISEVTYCDGTIEFFKIERKRHNKSK